MNIRRLTAATVLAGAALFSTTGTAFADTYPSNVHTPTHAVQEDEVGWNPLTMGNRQLGTAYQPVRDLAIVREIRALGLSPQGAVVRYAQPEDVEDVVDVALPATKSHPFGVVIYL